MLAPDDMAEVRRVVERALRTHRRRRSEEPLD
jgi:hypothetical protein